MLGHESNNGSRWESGGNEYRAAQCVTGGRWAAVCSSWMLQGLENISRGTHGLMWLGINSCGPLQLLGLGFVSEVVEGVGLSWLFAKQER